MSNDAELKAVQRYAALLKEYGDKWYFEAVHYIRIARFWRNVAIFEAVAIAAYIVSQLW